MAERVPKCFVFSLAPELTRRRARLEAMEREAFELVERSRDCESRERALGDALAETAQRQGVERDHLRGARGAPRSTEEWLGRARFVAELAGLEVEQCAALEAGRAESRAARHRLELAREELGEALARVRALERLEHDERRAHARAVERNEDERRDDEAVERWKRPSTATQA